MNTYVAYRIKERRQALGLRQDDLAKLLNLTQAQVSRYERGESEPTPDGMVALAKILDTTADYLLGLSNLVKPVQSESDLTELEQEIVNIMRSKSPEGQRKLVEVAKVM